MTSERREALKRLILSQLAEELRGAVTGEQASQRKRTYPQRNPHG
jgi:hypothetical protein